jgi:hypothetical protein
MRAQLRSKRALWSSKFFTAQRIRWTAHCTSRRPPHSLPLDARVPDFNVEIYSNEFLRFIFSRLQTHASHNLSYVAELELVVPVVDCTFSLLTSGDRTAARVYYLTRRKADPAQVFLLSTSMSVQDYEVNAQFQRGPGMVLAIAAIDDMQASTVTHHLAVAFN